jgi:predicted nucleic acid-binding protein
MKTALDTNIFSALWQGEPSVNVVSVALREAKRQGSLVVSPPAYAESLANPVYSLEQIHAFFETTKITLDRQLMDEVWTEAGLRYGRYAVRRKQASGEPPRRILADFLIGAHALLQADCLMTLDVRYYRQYFPELRLYPIGE